VNDHHVENDFWGPFEKDDKKKQSSTDFDSYLDIEEAETQIEDFRRKWNDFNSLD